MEYEYHEAVAYIEYGNTLYAIVDTDSFIELWVIRGGKLVFTHVLTNDPPTRCGGYAIEPMDGFIMCVLPDSIVAYDPAANWLRWRF